MNAAQRTDDLVLFAIKTPMLRQGAQLMLPADMSLDRAIRHLREKPDKDDATRFVSEQLGREMADRNYGLIAVSQTGEVATVDGGTTLRDIAVPREVRTRSGLKTIPTAAVEMQAYSPVG